MRKVSGSRPAGYKKKKRKKKKKAVSSLGGIEEKKERRIEPGKGEKTAQKKARQTRYQILFYSDSK